MKSFILVISLLLFSNQLFSFTITDVSGGSYVEEPSDGTFKLYAGMTGSGGGSACSSSDDSPCNSCSTASSSYVCNPREMKTTDVISVTLGMTGYTNPFLVGFYIGGSTAPTNTSVFTTTEVTQTASAARAFTTGISWGDVCEADSSFGSSACTPASAASNGITKTSDKYLYIWVDEDDGADIDSSELKSFLVTLEHVDRTTNSVATQNSCASAVDSTSNFGICGFLVGKSGDEKIYVDSIYNSAGAGNAPSTPSLAFLGVSFFYSKVSSATAVFPSMSEPAISLFDDSYTIDNSIDNLDNDYQYCLIMGNIDKAYNIFGYINPSSGTNAEYCQTPSPVAGLLEDQNCFISTAAFGSSMANEVQTFRDFRNQFLLKSSAGIWFVKTYYKYSPPIAQYIAKSDLLRWFVRGTLYPFLILSKLSLLLGVNLFFISLFLVLLSMIIIKKKEFVCFFLNKININKFYLFIFVFLFLPILRAELQPDSQTENRKPSSIVKRKMSINPDGLIKIDKDGNYIYKTPPQKSDRTSHVRVGTAIKPDVTKDVCTKDGSSCSSFSFDDMYGSTTAISFEYLYEKYFTQNKGKLGYQLGMGLQFSSGHGRIVNNPSEESVEKFSFFTVPVYAGAVYRFEYLDRQRFIPYLTGGLSAIGLVEKREDRNKINSAVAPGAYGAGGILVNLSAIDRELGAEFLSEYEVKNMLFSLEFKILYAKSDVFEVQSSYVQGGFGFDF